MLKNDLIGKRIPNVKNGSNKEQYIDELTDYTNLKNKKIVAITAAMKLGTGLCEFEKKAPKNFFAISNAFSS